MKICFATNNQQGENRGGESCPGKEELKIVSLADIGCTVELPETGDTLEYMLQKARYVRDILEWIVSQRHRAGSCCF